MVAIKYIMTMIEETAASEKVQKLTKSKNKIVIVQHSIHPTVATSNNAGDA